LKLSVISTFIIIMWDLMKQLDIIIYIISLLIKKCISVLVYRKKEK